MKYLNKHCRFTQYVTIKYLNTSRFATHKRLAQNSTETNFGAVSKFSLTFFCSSQREQKKSTRVPNTVRAILNHFIPLTAHATTKRHGAPHCSNNFKYFPMAGSPRPSVSDTLFVPRRLSVPHRAHNPVLVKAASSSIRQHSRQTFCAWL